jgi:hypothetical protein
VNEQLDKNIGDPTILLQQEFSEAWAHYRHLEVSRSKYLGFFFTVILATSGFVITIFKEFSSSQEPWVYFGLLSLSWVVAVLSFFIFTTIKKAGFVLRHYEDVMRRVRYLSYEDPVAIDALMNVREKNNPVMKMMLFSTQQTAELIPFGATVLICIVEGSALRAMWGTALLLPWQQWVLLWLLSVLVATLGYVLFRLTVFRIYQREENTPQPISTQQEATADVENAAGADSRVVYCR